MSEDHRNSISCCRKATSEYFLAHGPSSGWIYIRVSPTYLKGYNGLSLIVPIYCPVGTSCGYSVPFFDYTGERLVLDKHFEKMTDGSKVRPDGIPTEMVKYWNKKNGLSIDSMPGLKLADDLSTALVPPFKLDSIAKAENQNGQVVTGDKSSDTIAISKTNLRLLLASCFILGLVAMYGFQSSRHLVVMQ